MRVLFWVALIVVALLWLQHARKARLKAKMPPTPSPPPPAAGGRIETMVRCAHCGVHLPVSEAVANPAGLSFCSEEHRAQHRA